MRIDAPNILESMGFKNMLDFYATQSGTGVEITWLSAQPQPTESEIDAAAPNTAANVLAQEHTRLVALLSGDGPQHAKLTRGAFLTVLDAFNGLVTKVNEISTALNAVMTAIDNGATLAQVKNAVGQIADVTAHPTRTPAQFKISVANKINAGDADT